MTETEPDPAVIARAELLVQAPVEAGQSHGDGDLGEPEPADLTLLLERAQIGVPPARQRGRGGAAGLKVTRSCRFEPEGDAARAS